MIDYKVDGRDAALADMCEWFRNNPRQYAEGFQPSPMTGLSHRSYLIKKVHAFKNKARISVKWRRELSDRLKITDEDVVRATNTIVEMIERELIQGGTVRLTNFGDLKTFKFPNERRVRFRVDEKWARLLNEPLYNGEVGLKRKLKKNKLVRRYQ
jgi:nucleoid DNA-binding protein